jgi:mono/diheme cytochrome c family protein
MKVLKVTFIFLIAASLMFSTAYAMKHTPEERGKALLNDVKLGGGTTGKSCNTCHPNGAGLEKAADKKEFKIMGKTQKSLEEAINVCIEMALGGKAMDPKSDQMKDMAAYMKSLKGMMMEKKMPMKK